MCNCNYTSVITLHHNYNSTTLQLQLQLRYITLHPAVVGNHCNQCNHSEKHSSNHLSVHQWIRSAIRDSQQPTSPLGFLFLKLPPPPCAALQVLMRFTKRPTYFFCFWDGVKSQPVDGDLRIKVVVYGEYNELVLMGFIQVFLLIFHFCLNGDIVVYTHIYIYIVYDVYGFCAVYIYEIIHSRQQENGGWNIKQIGI